MDQQSNEAFLCNAAKDTYMKQIISVNLYIFFEGYPT